MDIFTINCYVQGTLAANHTFSFKLPVDAQLIGVSANNTTANAGTVDVGNSSDDDAYLDGKAFGVSGTPLLYDRDDFVGTQFPHVAAGTIILVTVTDHASHMAAADVLLIFTQG